MVLPFARRAALSTTMLAGVCIFVGGFIVGGGHFPWSEHKRRGTGLAGRALWHHRAKRVSGWPIKARPSE